MNQILSVWDALEPRKRFLVVLSAVVMFAAVLGLARMVNSPTLSLLYSGLDPSSSGEVVKALEGQNVQYEVRGNSIYVEKSARDQVRMSLASEGLPANGISGYELLDSLSGFGTTSQMFDAAYWRAKEGELARTILASSQVRAARVHISNSTEGAFGRNSDVTASVIVTMGSASLSTSQANAIRFLVASAVAGMSPGQVSVIDSEKGLVLAAGADPDMMGVEDTTAKAAQLKKNIERLLAARVGPGRAIVEVNIDADMNSETVTERVLDPEGRVAISSDVEEQSSSSTGEGSNSVTVASNLPDGDGQGAGGSQSSDSVNRERINYEVSEVRREKIKAPGEIRRISVAVLIDGETTVNDAGETVWTERSQDELESFESLVQSAIGYDAARGDVVTISSMEFTTVAEAGTLAEKGTFDFLAVNAMSLVQMLFLGMVALAMGMFVLKPIITSAAVQPADNFLTGETDNGKLDADELAGETAIELNPEVLEIASQDQLQVQQLKDTIAERTDDSKAILEDWLSSGKLESEGA